MMGECMDEQMCEWMDVGMDRWMLGWMDDGWMDSRKDKCR